MFISLSKFLGKSKIRIGAGMRITKSNAIWFSLIYLLIALIQLTWYMVLLAGWIAYAMCYGIVWINKKTILLIKIIFEKLSFAIKKRNEHKEVNTTQEYEYNQENKEVTSFNAQTTAFTNITEPTQAKKPIALLCKASGILLWILGIPIIVFGLFGLFIEPVFAIIVIAIGLIICFCGRKALKVSKGDKHKEVDTPSPLQHDYNQKNGEKASFNPEPVHCETDNKTTQPAQHTGTPDANDIVYEVLKETIEEAPQYLCHSR